MKIQCPSCNLTGTVSDSDVPGSGKRITCPRCKAVIVIEAPESSRESAYLMSICPVCQYSTFTDETFAVCPTCGTNGADYRKMLLNKAAPPPCQTPAPVPCDEAPLPDRQQMRRELEAFNRSRRNPDFAEPVPQDKQPFWPVLPRPLIRVGVAAALTAGLVFVSGLIGLSSYYAAALQPNLSSEYLGTMFSVKRFFLFGLFPWLRTLFGPSLLLVTFLLFRLKPWTPRLLIRLCWFGLGLVVIQEVFNVTVRVATASGSPSLLFYFGSLTSFLVTVLAWSAPFLLVLWLLHRDAITADYCRECRSTETVLP